MADERRAPNPSERVLLYFYPSFFMTIDEIYLMKMIFRRGAGVRLIGASC